MEKKCFAAYHKDNTIRMKSSSGGVFYALAEYVINQKGIVFGATWNKNWLVDITYTETLEGIKPIMTSKYVLSNVGNSFEQCKQFLDEGRLVLYTALPCQIYGLKNYLKKEYDNLITIAVACEGTTNSNLWLGYLDSLRKPNCDIVEVNMRDKEGTTWTNYNLTIKYSDGSVFKENHNKNKYMQDFIGGKLFRPCCHCCKFKKNQLADFIIGDYWGVLNYHDVDIKPGISFIITNTDKASYYLDILKDNFVLIESDINNVRKHNIGIARGDKK